MSAYSTLRITEDTARRLILSKILTYSDDELKYHVDQILDGRLYNCQIVPNGCENDDGEL